MRYREVAPAQLQLHPEEFPNSTFERGTLRMATDRIARLLRSSIIANGSLRFGGTGRFTTSAVFYLLP